MRNWSRLFLFLPLLALAVLAGCDRSDPLSPEAGVKAVLEEPRAAAATDDVVINGFRVQYEGRVVADDATTFTWRVSGTGEGRALDFFMVEVPPCAGDPLAWSPADEGELVDNYFLDLYGVKWRTSISPLDLEGRLFTITVPGDVAEGTVTAAVNGDDPTVLGEITGPCDGYRIAGTVFADANQDGVRDPATESGIADVVVELIDDQDNVATYRTGPDGAYAFPRPAGTYTVRIDTTSYDDAQNTKLPLALYPTTALEFTVTLGPSAEDVDFGWTLSTDEVIERIDAGELPTAGEGALFWKQQLRAAMTLEMYFEDPPVLAMYYGPEVMHAFLDEIRHLYLPDPFVFDPATEFQEAFDTIHVPYAGETTDELRKQLLVAELNYVSGQGIRGPDGAVMSPLLAWAEGVLADLEADDGLRSGAVLKAGDPLTDCLRVLRALNTGGGGDIDD